MKNLEVIPCLLRRLYVSVLFKPQKKAASENKLHVSVITEQCNNIHLAYG